jgi:hypothetical protein
LPAPADATGGDSEAEGWGVALAIDAALGGAAAVDSVVGGGGTSVTVAGGGGGGRTGATTPRFELVEGAGAGA